MATTRGRLVFSNQVVYDQADFFQTDGYTRVMGLGPGQLVLEVYFNNQVMAWPLLSGVGISEAQVTAGKVYWSEMSPAGRYSVRWRPNQLGFWRLLVTYPAGSQIVAQDYDVQVATPGGSPGTGLKSSFIGPGEKDVG